ncbi:ABC transporter permease [Alicyclobacillus sp. SO9]|uniref:ABC transporter permease n=1 Tax=Alicyclobacillus sp. SO9 TaxID=2665646 RepID=UPI0018E70243|nr:ABC transporter permease [Alicyclobacillus sp. SO9]QQE80389.1 ABC transporter permease [Alicyclobacillus sp. SO9]
MSAVEQSAGTISNRLTQKAFGQRLWKSMKDFPMVYVGGGIIVILVLVALLAPLLETHDPNRQYTNIGLTMQGLPVAPSGHFWWGTDSMGRDVYSRVIAGSRVSLIVGVASTLISLVIGTLVGLMSGFFGGWVDMVLMRLTDIILAFPFLLFALALIAVMGPSLWTVLFALGVTAWGVMARLVRGMVLQLKEYEYVQAERALGASKWRIMIRVILPNTFGPVIVFSTLQVGLNMLASAGLSYLGIGIQPPQASWGNMIENGIQTYQFAPWTLWAPGLALLIAVLAFNMLGDGLNDLMNPQNSNHG